MMMLRKLQTNVSKVRRRLSCSPRRYFYLCFLFLSSFSIVLFCRGRDQLVVVVEEHHEVLTYWWNAARKLGHPVTLIHIDAHSDSAPFHFLPGVNYKLNITSVQDLAPYIQRNDMFIRAAQYTGIVADVGWIAPFWEEPKTVELNHSIGWAKFPADGRDQNRHFCYCIKTSTIPKALLPRYYHPPNVTNIPEETCFIYIQPATSSEITTVARVETCHRVAKNLRMWSVIDRTGLKHKAALLRKHTENSLSKSRGKYILDIDLDYFAVELVGNRMVEQRFDYAAVEKLSQLLKSCLCPSQTTDELIADAWFSTTLACVLNRRRNCNKRGNRLLRNKLKKILCEPQCLKKLARKIVVELKKLPRKHLQLLQSIGVCLSKSLQGSNTERAYLELCTGRNKPGDSYVKQHKIANDGELQRQMGSLERMLRSLPSSPTLITICRSTRDGYFPRHLLSKIEPMVVAVMKRVFAGVRVVWDLQLSGGTAGWAIHKQQQLKKLSKYSQ